MSALPALADMGLRVEQPRGTGERSAWSVPVNLLRNGWEDVLASGLRHGNRVRRGYLPEAPLAQNRVIGVAGDSHLSAGRMVSFTAVG